MNPEQIGETLMLQAVVCTVVVLLAIFFTAIRRL